MIATDRRYDSHISLVSSYSLTHLTPQTQRTQRRCTICQVAGRVGEWMVFLRSIISPGVYAPDDPNARGGDGDTGGEFLTLSD